MRVLFVAFAIAGGAVWLACRVIYWRTKAEGVPGFFGRRTWRDAGIGVCLGTVAALAGRPEPSLPEEVARWVQDRQTGSTQEGPLVDESLTAKARRAIEAILSESELLELWEETDEFDRWQATVTDLLERLG